MPMSGISGFWSYIGRFSLIHLITYSLMAVIFLNLQDTLPASGRVALGFFEPYRYPDMAVIASQLIRGVLLALILYPFYDIIVKSRNGLMVLFTTLWGLGLLASVEPMPGSIEGMIYTQTTLLEHILVLAAVGVQTLLFCVLFLFWKRPFDRGAGIHLHGIHLRDRLNKGYLGRFTLLHIITYWAIGMAFYQLQGYEEALATMEVFELYRPLESFLMVAVVFFGQVVRGLILAVLLLPFHSIFMRKRHGWLLLFGLLWMVTGIGSVLFSPELLGSLSSGEALAGSIRELEIGVPEITVQMLAFSWLFWKWEKRITEK